MPVSAQDRMFDYCAILPAPASGNGLAILKVWGVNTIHGQTQTDRARLYGTFTASSGVLNLYRNAGRATGDLVLTGTASAAGELFDLTAANASGMTGQAAMIDVSADATFTAFVGFATDADVYADSNLAASMPGFDATAGLAVFHARAARQILAADLPAMLPRLFGGNGLGEYPAGTAEGLVALPDLSRMTSVDLLRSAQAALVKALSAEEREHQAEFAEMAASARERYERLLKQVGEANLEEAEAEAELNSWVNTGSFSRF